METVSPPNHRCPSPQDYHPSYTPRKSQKRCSWFKEISSNIWKRFLLYVPKQFMLEDLTILFHAFMPSEDKPPSYPMGNGGCFPCGTADGEGRRILWNYTPIHRQSLTLPFVAQVVWSYNSVTWLVNAAKGNNRCLFRDTYKSHKLHSVGRKLNSLDAFVKLRRTTIRFILSACPSTWNNWAPTERIFMKLIFENFSKICRENSLFIKIRPE